MGIGKNGMSAYMTAIQVTSQNISNVNTPGYSTQNVVLETAPSTAGNNGSLLGNGVQVSRIMSSYDALLQKQLDNAQTTQGYDTTTANALQQIEPSFNDVANGGLDSAISGFFSAFQGLSVDPTNQTARQAVLSSAQTLTDNFQSASRSLNNTAATLNNSLTPLTANINSTLNNIAQLNGQINSINMSGGNTNELQDQQQQLIQNLSQQLGVNCTTNSNGTTDLYITDNSANPPANYYLVKGTVAGSVNANTTNTNKTVITVTDNSGAAPVTSNAMDPTAATPFYTNDTSGGQLWATLKLCDVTIPGYQSQLDSLAKTIVTTVNAQQQAGSDLNGSAPPATVAFFDPSKLTAATIAINPALTSTNQIAAAANGASSGDNSNALLIANLQNSLSMSSNTQTFNGYYDSLVSKVGQDVQTANNNVTQSNALTQQLTTLQQSNSGVSLDEQLTKLMQYQQSYQASAKIITTATAMMDTVLGLIT